MRRFDIFIICVNVLKTVSKGGEGETQHIFKNGTWNQKNIFTIISIARIKLLVSWQLAYHPQIVTHPWNKFNISSQLKDMLGAIQFLMPLFISPIQYYHGLWRKDIEWIRCCWSFPFFEQCCCIAEVIIKHGKENEVVLYVPICELGLWCGVKVVTNILVLQMVS